MKTKNIIAAFLLVSVLYSCTKGKEEQVLPGEENTDVKINAFTITKADGTTLLSTEYKVNISSDSVNIIIPPLENLRELKAVVEHTGNSISPASGIIQSFTTPVSYKVYSANGSFKTYTVKAAYAKPNLVVFIGAGNNFYALNASTGAVIWSFTGGGSFAYSSATYRDNVVYVGSIDNYVYAFNASNGRLLWKKNIATTGIESDAVIADSSIYVGTNDDIMYALDATTGDTRWTFKTGGNISSSPKVANGNVYFGSSNGKLYALKAKSGELIWSYQTGGMLNQSGASLVNGVLYVGSRDGYLYAINESNGTLKWRYSGSGVSFEMSSPSVYKGTVYIGSWYDIADFSRKGSLHAVNANTGALVWEKLTNTGVASSPFVNEDRVCISVDGGKLVVLERTSGNTLWQKDILPNGSSPVEVNGIIYVGGGGTGYIYALDAITGNIAWRFGMGALMTSSPVIIDLAGVANYPTNSGMMD